MIIKFSIADVDKPTHATIVKGFHKYTRAARSPEGKTSERINILSKWEEQEFAFMFKIQY